MSCRNIHPAVRKGGKKQKDEFIYNDKAREPLIISFSTSTSTTRTLDKLAMVLWKNILIIEPEDEGHGPTTKNMLASIQLITM